MVDPVFMLGGDVTNVAVPPFTVISCRVQSPSRALPRVGGASVMELPMEEKRTVTTMTSLQLEDGPRSNEGQFDKMMMPLLNL